MQDEGRGVDLLRQTIDRVAAGLPPSTRGADRGIARTSVFSPRQAAALAAGVVLLILAYPAWLGVKRLRGAPAGGYAPVIHPAELYYLTLPRTAGALRGAEPPASAVQVAVSAATSTVLLVGVDPAWLLPSGEEEAAFYHLDLRNRGGEVVFAQRFAVVALRRLVATSEGVPLLIPNGRLPPDRYQLSLLRLTAGSEEVLSTLFFEVVTAARP